MQIPGIKDLQDKELSQKIAKGIKKMVDIIGRNVKLMHVCGTHENTISKFGNGLSFRSVTKISKYPIAFNVSF